MPNNRFIFSHFDQTNKPIDLRAAKEAIPNIRNSYFCGFRVQAPYGHHYYHTIALTDEAYQLRIASEIMTEQLIGIYPEIDHDNIQLVYTRLLMPFESLGIDCDIAKLLEEEFESALENVGPDHYFVLGQSGSKMAGVVIVEAKDGLAAMELAINISNKVHVIGEYLPIGAFQLHEVSNEFNILFMQHGSRFLTGHYSNESGMQGHILLH